MAVDNLSKEDTEQVIKALGVLAEYFLEHSAVYSKELMVQLEKETSIKWFMWSFDPINPTKFNPNHKIRYWIRRFFTLKFKAVVHSESYDGLGYSFINPFTKKYRTLKANEQAFIELAKQEYPKEVKHGK